MTMAEYRALLEWYSANKTYPAKTLKVALLDASAGRAKDGTYLREGSKYYANNLIPKGPQGQYAMFAADERERGELPRVPLRDAVLLERRRRANGGVGPWRTFITDTPSAPNSQYPDTGPGRRANIAANSAAITAFDADLKNAVTAGFAQQSAKYSGLDQAGEPAALQQHRLGAPPSLPPQVPQTPTVPSYTAAEQAQLLAGAPGRNGPRGADPARPRTTRRRSGTWASRASASAACRTRTSSRTRTRRPRARRSGRRRWSSMIGGTVAPDGQQGTPVAGMTTSAAATAVGDTNVKVRLGDRTSSPASRS